MNETRRKATTGRQPVSTMTYATRQSGGGERGGKGERGERGDIGEEESEDGEGERAREREERRGGGGGETRDPAGECHTDTGNVRDRQIMYRTGAQLKPLIIYFRSLWNS